MAGHAPEGNPQPSQRAQALIAGFLQRHRQMVSAFVQAQSAASGAAAGGPDAAPDSSAARAATRLGDYPVYAVHLANQASGLCAALYSEPVDDDALFGFACESLAEGLGLAAREAAELMVKILLQTPHNTDGSELDETQIRSLSPDELRWILILDIAQRDGEAVLGAFERGAESVEPQERDIEPLAALLNLPARPAPDSRRAAAKTGREPD